MHQIDTPSNAAEAPALLTAMRKAGFWVSGNPQTGQIATTGDQDYANAMMMEAINLLLWSALTPTKGQWTGMRDAIAAKLAAQFGAEVFFCTDTSAAPNQITAPNISPTPANQAALAGKLVLIEVANTTTLAAVAINLGGFGNVPLFYPQGATEPVAGLVTAGSIIGVVYDPAPVNGNGGAPIYGLAGIFTAPPTTQRAFTYAGNPNTHVAGHAGNPNGLPADRCFDSTDQVWWTCTITGNAAGAVWIEEGGGVVRTIKVQKFLGTGAYNYVPSAGMISCVVEEQAPGGPGGGTTATNGAAGGGGGAGEYSRKRFTAAQIAAALVGGAIPITIQAPAAPSTGIGGTSGNVTFGALLEALGGEGGGQGTSATAPSAPGSAQWAGQGDIGSTEGGSPGLGGAGGGKGGRSEMGGSGPYNFTAGGGPGNPTAGYGAGGGGAFTGTSGTAQVGGLGGEGAVVITEECSE